MLKVLIVSENVPSPIGGIERHCYNIQELFKDSSDIKINILHKGNVNHKILKKIDKVYFSFSDLKKKITASECNIVHVHGFASLIVFQTILICSILKKTIIYTPHFHPFYSLDNPLLGKTFFYILLKPLLKKINTIISINKEDNSFFSRFHNKVITMPNWLNYNRDIKEIMSQKSAKKENRMILFVGRSDDNKGVDHLNKLNPKQYNIYCVTKGAQQPGFTYYEGISEEQLSELYYKASLTVIPSRYEAFSYVALESLSHGTPILVSERVHILDHLPLNNPLVHTFQFKHYEEFTEQVHKIIADQEPYNLENALESILDNFDPVVIKNKLTNIYLQRYAFLSTDFGI